MSDAANHLPVFEIRESSICAKMRLNRDDVRARRKHFLVQGHHWDYVDKKVLYTAVGAVILQGTSDVALRKTNGAQQDSVPSRPVLGLLPEQNPPPVKFAGELLVWRCPSFNHRVLTAYIPGTDPNNPSNLVTVLVSTNRNFLPGMKISRLNDLGDNRYELVGPCPRWRGKW